VVVVSHDRWFLDRTVDRLFCFVDGRLERFEGNYSAYLERQAARQLERAAAPAAKRQQAEAGPSPTAPEVPKVPEAQLSRRRSYRESRELEALERDLPAWEERRRTLEAELAGANGLDRGSLEARSHELAELLERIAAAEERWLTLSEMGA
jgi:ATP-binding cassette subfamily F protein uup